MNSIAGVATLAALFFVVASVLAIRFAREIRNHRRACAALEECRRRAGLLSENETGMVLAFDMQGQLLFSSAGVERLTGYRAAGLRPETITAWVHPDDRLRMNRQWKKLLHGGASFDEEYRLVTKQGAVKWVSAFWQPLLDDTGCQIGIQGGEYEITARKQAEHALQESERRFRELMQSVPLAAVMVNLKGYVCFCNDYSLSLTGWSRDEVIGYPAHRFFDSEHRQHLIDAIALAQKTGEPQTPYESALLARNGARRWFRWSSVALRDASGQTIGFASLGADLTGPDGQKLQPQQLYASAHLVSEVAHDFNNVLAVINACSEMVSERLPQSDPARAAVEEIRLAGLRGMQLTQQLFAIR